MTPSNNVGMELPAPVNEQLPPVQIPELTTNQPEISASPFERAPAPPVAPPINMPAPPPPIVPAASVQQTSVTDNSQTTGLTADDGDVIEREWVNKAKAIVEQTKDDPYKQSEELKLLKSEYLQKRYNKTLKQSI